MRESIIFQEILEEGKQEEALSVVTRQLTRRFGALAPEVQERLRELSTTQLEDLAEALLDFSKAADVVAWLQEHEDMRSAYGTTKKGQIQNPPSKQY